MASHEEEQTNVDMQEVNMEIRLNNFHNIVNVTITVDDNGIKAVSEQLEYCIGIDSGHNGRRTFGDYNSFSPETVKSEAEHNLALMQSALNSTVLVDALESITVLKKKCVRLGINGNFDYEETISDEMVDSKPYGQYEVERILDHDTVRHLFLIKWKEYDIEHCTWEPVDHLSNVSDLVYDFRLMERSLSEDDRDDFKKLILLDCLLDELMSPANEDPFFLLKVKGEAACHYKPGDLLKLKKSVRIKSEPLSKCLMEEKKKFRLNYSRILEKLMKDLRIIANFESIEKLQEALKHRKRFFNCLKNWEANINRKESQDEGCAPIEIENNCDSDLPANDFTYITKCILGPGVSINDEPAAWFCKCNNDCVRNAKTCCPKLNGSDHVYDKDGRLKNLKQTTIFECNSKCRCSSTCSNRVIQNGRKFKLGIFKTEDGRGWGVKALERITKGQFIVEYVGEIITKQEAERRSSFGENPFHKTYLFDLEHQIGTHSDYVVDGAKFGNISRFINHSCTPNMEVYMFWIDNPDVKMPRIAFFSQKCVAKGEELTFDYRMNAPGTVYMDEKDVSLVKVSCKCGSPKCRKFLF